MVQACVYHGLSRKAIDLFKKMVLESESKPYNIMFLGVLSACNHGGLCTSPLVGLQYATCCNQKHIANPSTGWSDGQRRV
ncbi:hypothetical protein L1987_42694 [Smallanthus sonchifolius]|uniref:Uncharacterized protein n=1 Tax=Smallanthus sonchifolius TaxID=185202 RepID=A0ACB9GKJ2_9ASTR|nr:hypothetical protein L1987_42694 [Smallanthus sonchifolius]